MRLPIELWRLIFLNARLTRSIRKVCKAFRTTIVNPHFDQQHSLKWGLCGVLGCWYLKTDGWDYQPGKYCFHHECRGCHQAPRRWEDNYCNDCVCICTEPGCEKKAVNCKKYIENGLLDGYRVGYCKLHGCDECGVECERMICSACIGRWAREHEYSDNPFYS